ncbi:MAG: DNA mismatch repair endonuclease MutL [Prevotellaceae bacterium]|jgi:DNA mismatch repair protein MutL|nr:DNA mismatch repair endonuclease MutL [Prevotellaceae bacterium]
MKDIIQLLPDSVANQIAAGEVIQRPASVVKELVENALDAGADEVHILITDAGKTAIQVIDNGKGMSETDARLSFERHATSKIRTAADLFALHTMGFRGEALASVAAVAEVELKTRRPDEQLGTRIVIAGSKFERQETVSCAAGSNFAVKNLFFNVPARRKFLKSDKTEYKNICEELERIALVHPDVEFHLYHNDAEHYNLPASSLRQRILSVHGKKLNKELLDVEADTSLVKITGYVARPESATRNRAYQYFFVNGRYMYHPYFRKAVLEAYDKLIPAGEQVSYFLYFEVDPANIDVNIHPTKTEIKFENEHAVWQILAAAVKEALGKSVPVIDFNMEEAPDIPAYSENRYAEPPRMHYDEQYNPFKTTSNGYRGSGSPYRRNEGAASYDWEQLYAATEPDDSREGVPAEELPGEAPASSTDQPTLYGAASGQGSSGQYMQFKGRYILTSVKSGLMLIDQHRAHVRVLFEQYLSRIRTHLRASQGVLFPEILQLSAAEDTMIGSILGDLSAIGFELTPLGGGSYAVSGVPEGIEGLNPVEVVLNMLHTAMEKGSDVKDEVHHALALTLAKAAAIVYGQVLSPDEITVLTDSLFACEAPNYTPDGQLVLSIIREEEIAKLFKR